ncbi:LexA family protein [Streptomyces sp. bgisy084]|uniref:LexA family protein n=1 Tax=Streptomyces sp. bgisy084 TaxID=3413777 RepID=UPI003D74C277
MAAYITDSQRRIAQALRELTHEAGYPPPIRKIADAVARSASTVTYHLPAWNAAGSPRPTPRTAAARTRARHRSPRAAIKSRRSTAN